MQADMQLKQTKPTGRGWAGTGKLGFEVRGACLQQPGVKGLPQLWIPFYQRNCTETVKIVYRKLGHLSLTCVITLQSAIMYGGWHSSCHSLP